MAITHTQSVVGLQIINNSDNIVSEVTVKTVSVDDSDPSTLTICLLYTSPSPRDRG